MPNTLIVWSDILQRRYWHNANNGKSIEKTRKRVNLLVRNQVRPKKKICVFTVTRPTLIFASDPMHFYTEFG